MNRNVIVKNLDKNRKGRTIVISDIHANLDVYLGLLQKVNYQKNIDRLILLGDMIEKGPKNLETLHYIMHQVKTEDVQCIMGNCDFIAKNVLFSYRLDFLNHVLSFRKESLIHEMAHEIGIQFSKHCDMQEFCQQLRKHYLKELCFLNDLPHVLTDEDTIYVHASLVNEQTYGKDFREVMTQPFFLHQDHHFKKKVIVGHLPVTEYYKKIADFNPIYDAKRNIYSIDGGNIVKQGGQLNALIFQENTVTIESYDELPQKKVIRDVKEHVQIPFFITWNHGQVDILKREEKQSYVYSPYLNRKFWVENEFLSISNTEIKATDYTNYEMPLKKGDIVKVISTYQDKAQIKKNGILGWTYISNLE